MSRHLGYSFLIPTWELIDMDEAFPPDPRLTEAYLRQVELRELLWPGLFSPITPGEWQELHEPQPGITQL